MNVVVEFYNPWNAKLHRTVAQVCYEPTLCDPATSTQPTPPGMPPSIPSPLTSLTGMPIAPPT